MRILDGRYTNGQSLLFLLIDADIDESRVISIRMFGVWSGVTVRILVAGIGRDQ